MSRIRQELAISLKKLATLLKLSLEGSFNISSAAAYLKRRDIPGEEAEHGVVIRAASTASCAGQPGLAEILDPTSGVLVKLLQTARKFARLDEVTRVHQGLCLKTKRIWLSKA